MIFRLQRRCYSRLLAVQKLRSTRRTVIAVPFSTFKKAEKDPDGDFTIVRSSSAGMPDFVEHWNRDAFRKVGYGLVGLSAMSVPLFGNVFLSSILASGAGGYWYLGLQDIKSNQSIRRNFPVLGRVRYIFESIRPEIRQYFIEGDEEAVPFSRGHRSLAYQRARGITAAVPFGTKRDTNCEFSSLICSVTMNVYLRVLLFYRVLLISCCDMFFLCTFTLKRLQSCNVLAPGYEWVNHSMYPTHLEEQRVVIGANNPLVKQPYSSSIFNISASKCDE